MKSLGPLPLNTLPYFTAIAAAKQQPRRQRLQILSPHVAARYTAYAQNTANLVPLGVVPVTPEQRTDLIHCYESPTGALNGLKVDIEKHHNNTCPDIAALCQYCGLTYGPSEFDHYLPKESFPEFSVLSLNLVPCCGECNGLKGTAWLDANGVREIVSLYYDTLPNQRFLHADIQVNAGPKVVPVAQFRLSNNPADYGGLMATVHNHYKNLDLLVRYRRAACARFSDIKIEFGPLVLTKGIGAVAQMLLKKAGDLNNSRSPNYWEVALLSGMANSAAYLNSLP